MILKRSLQKFLSRPRRDYREFKRLSLAELEDLESELPVQAPIWNRLNKTQRVCLLIGAERRRFAFHIDTGMGKTLLAIALARYFEDLDVARRYLVLVPGRANKTEWASEFRKHTPDIPFHILRGSSAQKWDQLRKIEATFFVDTYASFVRMLCKLVKNKKREDTNKLKPSPTLVKHMQRMFQGFILDEITMAKNKKKLPYRLCRQMAKTAEVIFTLTGTPFGRDPTDVWSQMYLVDNGYTLGENLALFRAAFFEEKQGYWATEYRFDKKKAALLNKFLAHSSIRYEAAAGDMPPVVPIRKYVTLPSDTQTYYDRAKDQIISAHGNYQEMKNAFLRMRQISSGFLGYVDDERGVRAEYEFKPNPKLELLLSIVQSIPKESKIVIYHEFVFSGSIISRELEKLGIGHCRIMGGGKEDPDVVKKRFDTDPDCQVNILSNAAGGFGLNLQVARYGIYYESPVSAIIRKQTQRRIERQHSKHDSVFIYDLLVRRTYDERILTFHKEGGDLFSAIIEGRAPV